MKKLYVIRHAKSSWDDPGLDDFDRPLNHRGKNDAPKMGNRLKAKDIEIDLFYSSPAKRALSTAKRIAEVVGYPEGKIRTERSLYHAAPGTIISIVRNLEDNYSTVAIFGHNPGLTDFVNLFLDTPHTIDNVPTCGIVSFEFNIQRWGMLSKENASFLFFDFPKKVGT